MNEGSQDHPNVVTHPPFLFLGGLAAGWALEQVVPLPRFDLPLALWIGGAMVLAGAAVMGFAVSGFLRAGTNVPTNRPSTSLVTGGLHGYSRNPIYLGMTAIYLGITVMTGMVWMAILLVPVLAVLHWGVILREERYLEQRFGADYRAYKARVRRWL